MATDKITPINKHKLISYKIYPSLYDFKSMRMSLSSLINFFLIKISSNVYTNEKYINEKIVIWISLFTGLFKSYVSNLLS